MDFFTTLHQYPDIALVALRIAVGAIFIYHGRKKFGMWKMQPSEQMKSGMLSLMRFLSIAETLGGIAVLIGFLTQFAAAGLGFIMIGAIYFKRFKWKIPFWPQDKTGWEFDLILLAACIALFIFGAGSVALDRVWWGL